MASILDHIEAIDKVGLATIEIAGAGHKKTPIYVRMRIKDVAASQYGHITYLCEPLEGSGQAWMRNVILEENQP